MERDELKLREQLEKKFMFALKHKSNCEEDSSQILKQKRKKQEVQLCKAMLQREG